MSHALAPIGMAITRHWPDLHAVEHKPVDTGILDAKGQTIWRISPPIGFGRDKEW